MIVTREIGPASWPDIEALFGANGACGGCWCMHWRIEKGEDWATLKGTANKRRFRALVAAGRAGGVLAYVDGQPVGWAAVQRRRELPRLDRAPSLACEDADRVWSLPCFYVKAGFRQRGVASALLKAAIRSARRQGGRVLEGYPVRPSRKGEPIPAAFAWTGTLRLFEAAGFVAADARERGKQRMRLETR
ncbi:MAG: GNAT family N-acetyltransferase [Alphaproteobacteria bacterium]|nr:GNAT family N-acetyltransferase [Alphaproteobacteria bacterium]